MVKIIKYSELKWNHLEKENAVVGFNPRLVFKKFDVIHAKLKPKEKLNMHYHERGENGQEVFCFYNGGQFKLLLKDLEKEFDTKDPVYINFENNEIHGIENLSYKTLEFQVWCSPPFKPGEVIVL